MAKGTASQFFTKVPQIAAETVEGTPNASATFVNIGAVMSLSIKKDGGWQDISQLGAEDLIALIQGLQTYETQVKFAAINSTFAKRFINASNETTPAGTISESFTMVCSIPLNGTENYIVFKGSRGKDIEFTREAGKADEFTVTMVHTKITVPATSSGLTSPVFDSAASGAVFSSYSGGSNSVSWGGTPLDCKKITVKINRSTNPDHTIGNPDPFGTKQHGRRITFDFDVIWTTNALETDYENGTAKTLAIVVKTAVSTFTISSGYLTSHTKDFASDDDSMAVEKCTGKALACAIT